MSFDSKKNEDEWFHRHEKELIKNLKREREHREKELAAAMKAAEARKLKELHWMKCPKCGSEMKERKVEHVHVDECPLCEGIYMDRGELEQLVMQQRREPTSFVKKLLGLGK